MIVINGRKLRNKNLENFPARRAALKCITMGKFIETVDSSYIAHINATEGSLKYDHMVRFTINVFGNLRAGDQRELGMKKKSNSSR